MSGAAVAVVVAVVSLVPGASVCAQNGSATPPVIDTAATNALTRMGEYIVTVVKGVTYEQCGSTWYQPQFLRTEATYVVVSPPR
jgi:hypothetical protein